MKEIRTRMLAGGSGGVALTLLALIAVSPPAKAHDWYPYQCCSGRDCRPVPDDEVRYTPAGWLIRSNGETIPFNKARFSPDGHFHVCSYGGLPEAKTICLFAPGNGS